MKAAIRGTEIYYDISGMQLAPVGNKFVNRPVLFMLHGGPGGDHLRFKQHSIELHDVAQLVFIDHRGCGRSKKTKRTDYTLENNIEDIEALRKHLGLEKIFLLGTSYGGMVAQGYASRYPKRVEKLILVATSPSFRFIDDAKKYLQAHANTKQLQAAQILWDGNFKTRKQLATFFQTMDPLYSVTARKKTKANARPNDTVWSLDALNQAFGGFLRNYDFIPKLKKITCPTLVLGGLEDWICSPNQSKTIAQHIPKAKLHLFKNCSHAIAVDAHEKYINIIKKFLLRK